MLGKTAGKILGKILSPVLFKIYYERYKAVKINGNIINNLRYANNTVLIADSERLQELIELLQWVTKCQKNLSTKRPKY